MKLFATALSIIIFSAVADAQNNTSKTTKAKFDLVKVEGTITKFEGKYLYAHHQGSQQEILDSTKVISGKFAFNLKVSEPELYWITTERSGNPQQSVMFFPDKAPMKAVVKGDSLPYSVVEGGNTQKDYYEYRALVNSFVMVQQKMQSDFNVAVQNNDVNTQNAIRAEYQNLNVQYLGGIRQYIKNHPKSVISGYIICTDLNNPQIPFTEVEQCVGFLDKEIAQTKYAKQAIQRIETFRGSQVGYKANNFTQPTPEGKMVSLSDFKGQYVLLDFWASWCRPCRMENPNVVAAYNRFKDKGFTVLGVSLDSNKEPWVNAIQQDRLTWTHVSDLKGWGSDVGRLYNVTGIPQNFLLDKEGKIIAKDLRGPALDEKLQEVLK